MTTVKISQLPAILGAATATTDVLPLVDVSANTTNKITRAEFFSNIGNLSGVGTITGATTLSLLTTTTSAFTLDSGTTGAINIGTNANAKTITIGNGTGATSLVLNAGTGAINIGTNAIARTITVGNTTGASALTLEAGTGALNIGTGAFAKTITIGNGTGATSVVLNAGTGPINIGTNAIARTTSVGNTTGASILNLQAGTGGVSVLTGTTGAVTIDSGTTGAINIGVNANAKTVTVGNGTGATSVVLNAGTGPINIGTNAVARTTTIGNTTGASALALNAGTGHILMTGNVGLGITPTQKLHVSGNILSSGSIDAGTQFLGQAADTVSTPSYSWTGDTTVGMYRPAANTIGFSTTSLERMRITSTGNVGIGTTSPTSLLHVLSTGDTVARVTSGDANTAVLDLGKSSDTDGGRIAYDSGNNLLLHTASAERVRITSTGNVGIGTATPTAGYRLDVFGQAQIGDGGGNADINFNASSTGRFLIAGTERMRITSAGNVGIGTSSPSTYGDLAVIGKTYSSTGYALTADASNFTPSGVTNSVPNYGLGAPEASVVSLSGFESLRFYTQQIERARIDASGNLLVGATSQINGHTFKSNDGAATYRPTATAGNGIHHFYSNFGSTQSLRAYFNANGGLHNYSANNVNLSDERVKTDILPVGSYWDKVKALQVVTYKYRDQGGGEDNIGVIAQQVESVAPEFVCTSGFGETPEDGVPLKSIYETDMHYATLKALQEAMARIEALEAQLNP